LPGKNDPDYYREYTVNTPGAKDRGARRIVRGKGGETYYTDDHYRNFIQIDPRKYPDPEGLRQGYKVAQSLEELERILRGS
jgi:hypothetical protein